MEEKRLKSELRALEKEEEALLLQLETLETERLGIESSMSLPEVYANGERMKELRRQHGENHRQHSAAMEQWERVEGKSRETRERMLALRPDTASR